MDYRCLIIDDDRTIAETTAEYFNIFDIKTAFVCSFEETTEFLKDNTVSLVLLDINLGDKSGFELCKLIRREYDMPILFISARTSDDDVLTALNIGGDDYIKKPFTLNILLAKVKAILTRYEKAAEAVRKSALSEDSSPKKIQGKIRISGERYLDTAVRKLIVNGRDVVLKAMEFRMLLYLLENRGRVVTKDEFLKNVWEDEFTGEGTLAVHIRHLREKLGQTPDEPEIIRTVWGVGYIIDGTEEQQL